MSFSAVPFYLSMLFYSYSWSFCPLWQLVSVNMKNLFVFKIWIKKKINGTYKICHCFPQTRGFFCISRHSYLHNLIFPSHQHFLHFGKPAFPVCSTAIQALLCATKVLVPFWLFYEFKSFQVTDYLGLSLDTAQASVGLPATLGPSGYNSTLQFASAWGFWASWWSPLSRFIVKPPPAPQFTYISSFIRPQLRRAQAFKWLSEHLFGFLNISLFFVSLLAVLNCYVAQPSLLNSCVHPMICEYQFCTVQST